MTIRALVVDDSVVMQQLISAVLSADPEIEVVGRASDSREARAMIKELDPDVITLDIEMPGMNGLEFLEKIMTLRPMPVVIISSHTGNGTGASTEALRIGAFACLEKPRMDDEEKIVEMRKTVRYAAAAAPQYKARAAQPTGQSASVVSMKSGSGPDVVAIGASTGGVEALSTVLTQFPENCPPTVVTLHLPEKFTKSFAERLNRICAPSVYEASDGRPLKTGEVYIAPGTHGHLVVTGRHNLACKIRHNDLRNGHRPSVDELFDSLVPNAEKLKVSAAILTGMGKDGAQGMLALKHAGAHTIAQDRSTSMVYGMPAAAAKIGAVDKILPLPKIAKALLTESTGVN